MKKALSIILTLCMLFGLTAVFASAEEAEMPFTDVKSGKWFYDEVKYVWEAGVMTGKSDTKFEPNANMTRAELVTILFRLAKVEGEGFGAELGFNDTQKTAWYADYVGWAVKEGLVNGYEGNIFKPNAPILRQELAKLVVVFLDYLEVTVEGEALIESFADAAKHPKWAAEFIESLRLTGLVGGDTSGNFNPKATATRAEVATILTRLIPALEKTPDVPDVPKTPILNFDEGLTATGNAGDPNPDNIGILYEDTATGLKISEVINVDDDLTNPGTTTQVNATGAGVHGWHETRIVRTENGTYVTYIRESRPDDKEYPLGNTYTWDKFCIMKITSEGSKLIYEDEFPHANGSCTPNVLKGDNGMIYVTIIAEDQDSYLGSYNGNGFDREATWLNVYEIDTNTDTCVYEKEVIWDFVERDGFGFGYTQPILDRVNGKIYAMYNSGLVPARVLWYVYDLETHTWDMTWRYIDLPWRIGYYNAYADGMGGAFIVVQRIPRTDLLGELLGVEFLNNHYVWDALYLLRIPDLTKNEYTITPIYEPRYSTTEQGVKSESTSHYGSGGTLLASNGLLHVVYSNTAEGKTYMYHCIFDAMNGFEMIKNEKISLQSKSDPRKNSYQIGLAENTSGDIFILAVNSYMTSKTAKLEIWQSSDSGESFTKICDPVELKIKGAAEGAETFAPTRFCVGNRRSYSVLDNIVPVVAYTPYDETYYDYIYCAVELPN
ncbi:MAG: S-layer homology domain-containing protein [Clostridia bacterium]|nr:S-layer homology domain-containing protein [Clostridia bacterium]